MKEIAKLLKKGKTIIYPTDTAYALGGDFLNKKVREKIYKIKQRDKSKELSVIANSLSMVKKYCQVNAQEEKLARKYWPGPLTLVLQVKPAFQEILGETLAVRVPDHKFARNLSKTLDRPVIATSANTSGKATCYNIENVLKQLSKSGVKLDISVDDGVLKHVPVSTIVQVKNDKIKIIRRGGISL